MAFKIVGADENGNFPTRVMNRLAALFAAVTHTHSVGDITNFNTSVDGRFVDASDTVKGKVELATTAEATTGTDATRAVTPAGLKAVADTKAAASHTHTTGNITGFSAAVLAAVPTASETAEGKVELATTAEAVAGTDTARAVTPAGMKAAINAIPTGNFREDPADPGFFIY